MSEFGFEKNKIWQAAKPEKVIDVVNDIPEALRNKNIDQIRDILSDPQILRGAIINRNENNKNLILLRDSFDMMFVEKFGKKEDLYFVDSKIILDWVHEIGWPENILNGMAATAFHLQDDRKFFRIINIIFENESRFENPSVVLMAMNDLASWQSAVEKNPNKAIGTNKEALGLVLESNDKVLETKIRFGMTYDKSLKPKDKANDFENYLERFEDCGVEIEAVRAMIEAADAYANLAKGQWGNSAQLKIKNLDKAEYLAQEALKKAYDLGGYTNAIIKAHKVLQKIYTEQGDQITAEKHKKEAENIEKGIEISQK